ncbi:hypothetical protein MN116_000906 [Schistosoma mekongi]|uniref:Uncharacterized protein n=1 Tax=Schistosoma mekongi TaxID=38744 RepID=A0AAE1ZKN3_SCHME|nr:hypothetical protein MN116_000906 [Schistosoma mekongi]
METNDVKRSRKLLDAPDERKSSGSGNYFMNSIRPVQMDPDKYPGFYVFQESVLGNVILPVIPRNETNK